VTRKFKEERRKIELGLLDFNLRAKAQIHGIRRLEIGVFIVNGPGILLARRVTYECSLGRYELPGGTVKPRETLVRAAKREVYEQLGLTVSEVLNIALGFDSTDSLGCPVRYFLVCAYVPYVCPQSIRLNPSEHDHSTFISDVSELHNLPVSQDIYFVLRRILSNREVVTTLLY
jgi:8-oxo-dGTP pyrophosphatase MutT (NUDIX family)